MLAVGDALQGLATADGSDTGYAMAPGWRLAVNGYGNFMMMARR